MSSKKARLLPLIVVLAFAIALALPSLALAGGWAVVTLDELPKNVVAGQPYPLGLMGRQHGRTPMEVDQITIEARHAETGETVTFIAKPDQKPGHFQTELLFPKSGVWEWSAVTGFFPEHQPLPALEVADAALVGASPSASVAAGTARPLTFPQILMGSLTLLAFAAGVVMILRSRGKRPRILYGAVMAVACGSLIFALFSSVNAQAKPGPVIPVVPVSSNSGQHLFLAKGCVVCHINDRAIENSADYSVAVGPNLTNYSNDPEYLRKWLADPSVVRSTTMMPNLGLNTAEIDALIEFLNGAKKP